MKYNRKFTRKQYLLAGAVAVLAIGAGASAYVAGSLNAKNDDTVAARYGGHSSQSSADIPAASQARIDEAVAANTKTSSNQTVDDRLVYLAEEEKLAHDVYQKMYDLYGAKTFKNIMASETRHQERVVDLLNDRDIADPRSSSVGVFQNKDLQALYDKLVAQGSQSLTEAYKTFVS